MHDVSPLLRTPDIMSWFDHPAGVHHADPPEERVDDHAISFVETGHLCPSAVFARAGWCSTPAIKNTALIHPLHEALCVSSQVACSWWHS